MRPGRNQTGMKFLRYISFAAVYMKPGRNAWCQVSIQNDISCAINVKLTRKYTGLKLWTRSEICCDFHETGTNSDLSFSSRSSQQDEARPV